jgi:hypothetical protein
MSRQFLTSLDLNKNELLNAKIQSLSTAPSSPVEGQIYYNTTDKALFQYNGTAWKRYTQSGSIANGDIAADAAIAISKLAVDPLARANHTGTQLASTISDFNTAVQLNRLDQLAAPTASVSLNSQRITGLAEPTEATDAATKAYVDAARSGLDVKASCRVATTENITLSGTQTIDGIAVIAGDRVLVKNQSTASENGIWVVSASAWSRSTDADTSAKVTSGLFTFIEEGTTNDNSGWVLTTDNPIVLGTTPLVFTQFSGAGQITAGNGLTKNGNTIDAVGTNNRITVTADAIDIAETYVGQTSITTLGTIATGTWNATTIDVAKGGTGATTLTGYIKGNGTSPFTTTSTIPGSDVNGDITGNAANVNGTVAIANGGTGATTAANARANLGATTKYSASNPELVPSSGLVTWTVTHNLGTSDVLVQIRDINSGAMVETSIVVTSSTVTTISWAASDTVAANSYRVVVIG